MTSALRRLWCAIRGHPLVWIERRWRYTRGGKKMFKRTSFACTCRKRREL